METMNKRYVVFWISTQREVYGDDSYHVLGEWMANFDSIDKAKEYIGSLNLSPRDNCTIIEIYSGKTKVP